MAQNTGGGFGGMNTGGGFGGTPNNSQGIWLDNYIHSVALGKSTMK